MKRVLEALFQPLVLLLLGLMLVIGTVRQWMCPPSSPRNWTRWFAWHPVVLSHYPYVIWWRWVERRATINADMISFRYWTYRRI